MDRQQEHTKRVIWRVTAIGGAVTVAAAALAVFAPAAGADTVSVGYGSCTSNQPAVAAPPPNYTTQVTMTPQGSSFQVGKAVTIKWHYSVSTAPGPVGIPVPDVATAKAKIVITGAASSTISTESSANFPPVAVTPGQTFQIPDMTATFTPTAAGTYKLTPGDNEQDVKQFGVVVTCKASASGPAATITVAAASGGSGGSSSSSAASSSTSAAGGSTSSSSTTGELPHTGFDGRWLAGGVVLAAVLGGGSLFATRRRRGSHGS
jgi:LPXTG-motif cell wall-anchored protein